MLDYGNLALIALAAMLGIGAVVLACRHLGRLWLTNELYKANLKIRELERERQIVAKKITDLHDAVRRLKTENGRMRDLFAEKTNHEVVDENGLVEDPVSFHRYYFWEVDRAKAANQMLNALDFNRVEGRYVVDYDDNSVYAKVWFNPLKTSREAILDILRKSV